MHVNIPSFLDDAESKKYVLAGMALVYFHFQLVLHHSGLLSPDIYDFNGMKTLLT